MIRKFLIIFLFILGLLPFTGTAMVRRPDDLVTQVLSVVFDVDKEYEAILKEQREAFTLFKSYDDSLLVVSLEELSYQELKKHLKKISLNNHPDKHPEGNARDAAKAKMQKILEASKWFNLVNSPLELYNSKIASLKIYGKVLIGLASVVVAGLTYQAWSSCKLSTPRAIVRDLSTIANTSIDRLERCTLDRFAQIDEFLLATQVNITNLIAQLPEDLGTELTDMIGRVDETLKASFTKIAWSYYDCSSIDDLRLKDPELIDMLEDIRTQLRDVLNRCSSELRKQNKALLVKTLKGFGVITALTGIASGVGYWWLHRGSHQVYHRDQQVPILLL